jgi:Uma2 family endonuclease
VDVPIDEFNVFQPDLAVFAGPVPWDARCTEIPAVVFEILSPTSRRRDRRVKAPLYLSAGVREVWLVDPEERRVEIVTPEGSRTVGDADPATSPHLPGFVLVPRDLFSLLDPEPDAP